MRSAFLDRPREIGEAARVDGANERALLLRVMLPLAKPALSAVAVLTFLACWNDFLIPLILLNNASEFTLPLGLNYLTGQYMENWPLIAAATLITAAPGVVVYLVFQRRFVRGIVQGALK
jgi:ABC-type glycerol-3-phosphate transport system permease component